MSRVAPARHLVAREMPRRARGARAAPARGARAHRCACSRRRVPIAVSSGGVRTFSPKPIATHSAAAPRQRVSIRTPASLRPPTYRSFGHFTAIGSVARSSSASAANRPQRSESTSSARASRGRSMSVSHTPAPAGDVQRRPCVPRPAVCSSARMSVPGGDRCGDVVRDVERRGHRRVAASARGRRAAPRGPSAL